MRSNLIQLQNTTDLLDRTEERLASGKKVNSALDNPINYFASQDHLSRASDISTYQDNMSEGIETIQSANSGITGIETLIESARSLANSALSADANSVGFTVESVSVGDTVTIGGSVYTAVASTATASSDQFNIQDKDGNDLSMDEVASNLASKINSKTETTMDMKATLDGSRITLTAKKSTEAITSVDDAVSGSSGFDIDDDVTTPRADLAQQYEDLLTQIDNLGSTAGYKGVNLLADDTLTIKFEGGSLSVNGFDANVSDLGINTTGEAQNSLNVNPEGKWALSKDIKKDLVNLEKGLSKLQNEASKLSSAVSVVNAQQTFSTSKINILTEGADNLTAADTNEEGANMLMLQTRQSLSTTALSLSSQAAQSVLQLFG
jgi:flagellin-like hook-associated protein FlgL